MYRFQLVKDIFPVNSNHLCWDDISDLLRDSIGLQVWLLLEKHGLTKITLLRVIPTMTCWVEVVR